MPYIHAVVLEALPRQERREIFGSARVCVWLHACWSRIELHASLFFFNTEPYAAENTMPGDGVKIEHCTTRPRRITRQSHEVPLVQKQSSSSHWMPLDLCFRCSGSSIVHFRLVQQRELPVAGLAILQVIHALRFVCHEPRGALPPIHVAVALEQPVLVVVKGRRPVVGLASRHLQTEVAPDLQQQRCLHHHSSNESANHRLARTQGCLSTCK